MSSTAHLFGVEQSPSPLRDGFLRWQCRVRQMDMRENMGRPGDGVMPEVTVAGHTEPLGHIITVLSKSPAYDKTPELKHMFRRTHDPAQRREKAVQFFAETYYQKAREFSDILTATFQPGSPGAKALMDAGACILDFDAFGQNFNISCKVAVLKPGSHLHQATLWHNLLFNPNFPPQCTIFAFVPDWDASSAEPAIATPR
ncbi:MAG: hypothetical protein ACR2OR_11980 [Hyphomicrobiales bacterium]